MDLWLSTSNLDTWAHGQSTIHGAPEFILSSLKLYTNSGSIEPFVMLGDGEEKRRESCSDDFLALHPARAARQTKLGRTRRKLTEGPESSGEIQVLQ